MALILAITMLSVALPGIQADLHLSATGLVLVGAAYGLSFSGLLLLGGRIVDLAGPRRVFTLATAGFALASVGSGFAPNAGALLAGRFAQGVAAAFAAPAAMALAGVVFAEPQRRKRAMAIWGLLAPLGATAGTLASGAVTDWVSWRWTFVVPTAVGTVAPLLSPRLLPDRTPSEDNGHGHGHGHIDVLGAVLATTGLSALSYGLVRAADAPWTSGIVVGPGVVGAILLGAFGVVEHRAAEPLLPLRFLASRRRMGALWAVLVGSAGTSTMFFLLSLYFQQVDRMSPIRTSAAFLPFSAALLGAGMLAPRAIEAFGARVVTIAGLAIGAVGLFLLSSLTVNSSYTGALLGGLVLFPAGVSVVFSAATVLALEGVPSNQVGTAGGVVNTALETGPTVGLAVLVSLAASHTNSLAEGSISVGKAAAQAGGYGFAFKVAAAMYAFTAIAMGTALLLRRGAMRRTR
ncbi:DHA2 family efflux MFS transporter permease subunit [Catenulispora yoronensis]|uniref:DHA2 family efflux MFS transporter permease subunit n=1 Tax=Catenulispora yoronensis TaxID=450799 RepID=A0ABP5F4W9_9ACTN